MIPTVASTILTPIILIALVTFLIIKLTKRYIPNKRLVLLLSIFVGITIAIIPDNIPGVILLINNQHVILPFSTKILIGVLGGGFSTTIHNWIKHFIQGK